MANSGERTEDSSFEDERPLFDRLDDETGSQTRGYWTVCACVSMYLVMQAPALAA